MFTSKLYPVNHVIFHFLLKLSYVGIGLPMNLPTSLAKETSWQSSHPLSLFSLQNQSSSLILSSEAYHLLKPPLPLFHLQQINHADLLLSLQHHLIPFPKSPNLYLKIIKSIYSKPIAMINSSKEKK